MKKFASKLLAGLLAIVLAIGLLPPDALAAPTPQELIDEALSEVMIYNSGENYKYLFMGGAAIDTDYVFFKPEDVEIPAYCINPHQYGIQWFADVGEGVAYTKDEAVKDPKVIGIIINGYPHWSAADLGVENGILAFYATKVALWCYLRNDYSIENLRVNPSLSGDEKTRGDAVLAAAKAIYTRGMNVTSLPEYQFTIQPVAPLNITDENREQLKVNVGGTEYYAQEFKVMTGTWTNNYQVRISITTDIEGAYGAIIANADNIITSTITVSPNATDNGFSGYFKVLYPAANLPVGTDSSGTVVLSASATLHQYAIYSVEPLYPGEIPATYRPAQKYLADLFPSSIDDTATANSEWTTSESRNEDFGSIIIRKYRTGTTTLLPSAQFRVTGPNGYDRTVTSNSTTEITLTDLALGSYTVQEVVPPADYIPDSTPQTKSVTTGGTAIFTFYNTPDGGGGGDDGSLIIRKYETGTSNPLGGAGFLVRSGDGTTVGTYHTDSSGRISLDVDPGTYFVSEISPPRGYVMDSETKSATVPPNGSRTLTFYNDKQPEVGSLVIRKYATGTTTPLGGAHFEVKSGATGEVVRSCITDSTGTATVSNLEPGVYFITETQAPTGYLIAAATTQNVTVPANGTGTATFYNDPYGELRIEKRDEQSGAMLSGAVIEIRNITTGAVFSGITTTGGAVNFTNLVPGAYEIRELVAPDGYVLDTQVHTVNALKHQTVTYTLMNEAKPGLMVLKYDADTMELLSGVTFEVYRNAALYGTYTTDATGRFTLHNLQPGTYMVKEIAAGGSYVVNSSPQQIELTAGTGIAQLVFFNRLKPGILISKIDGTTLAPIPGVHFRIQKVGDTYFNEYVTNANGEINLTMLEPGVYQVTEVSAPDGYVMDDAVRVIQINAGENAQFIFTNSKKPGLVITKYDTATDTYLQGATFTIQKIEDGARQLTRTTDANGEIRLAGLEPGVYQVIETAAPTGYILDATPHHVQLYAGRTSNLIIENEAKPHLRIVKTDADTGAPLAGATYTVSVANGAIITTVTTDANGEAWVRGIDVGTYQVIEQSPPAGYLLNPTPQMITLVPNETGTVRFQNYRKPSLTLIKCDAQTMARLPNVTFEVYRDTVLVGTYTTDASGEIRLYDLKPGTYLVKEVSAGSGHVLNSTPQQIVITADNGDAAVLVFFNYLKPGIHLTKVDSATLKPLANATYRIQKVGGSFDKDYTTDANGEINLTGLAPGTYTVTETKAPDGYLIDNATRTIQINEGENAQFVFTDTKAPTLTIVKQDSETGAPLPGAVFLIQQMDGGYMQERTTGTDGTIALTDLAPGLYAVTEVIAPNGYLIDNARRVVALTAGENERIIFTNTRRPQLRIVKYDAQSKAYLAGATFEVYRDAVLIGSYTTDGNGEILLRDLTPGTYLVKEVSPPGGYTVQSTPQQIEITAASGDTATLVFFNYLKPGIHLTKVDSATLKPLANAVYIVKKVGGTFSKEYTTDANGEINLTGLEPGAYTVTETKAPDGYLIDNAIRTIQINEGENAQFVFTDTVKPGLAIVKYDPNTGKYLAGATFRIARIQDGTNYLDRVTDTDGKITLTGLEPGVYSIRETAAPSGFVLNDTEYHVELFPGKVSQIVVNNEAKPHLQIIKTDANTGKRLAGATFTVKKADGQTITTVTTDANGEAFIRSLDPGVFTVAEITPPVGYLLNDKVQSITLTPNHTGVVQFENYPKPELTIHKIDSFTKDPIKGAKFHIVYASNNTFNGELRDLGYYFSDEDGIIALTGLEDGWYRITEVEPAKGYAIKDPATQDVFIKAGTGKVVTFENVPLSAIVIRKVCSITGVPLQGAKFQVRYLGGTSGTGGTVIGSYTTSVNGTIVITGLAAGTYVIEETKAPSGFTIDEATQTVYLSGKDQDAVTVEFTNSPDSGLLIRKLDSATSKPLAGATFKVTDSKGTVVGDSGGIFKTDASGQIYIPGLPTAAYIVQETTAPEGYVLDTASQTVTLTSGKLHTLTFYNTQMGGIVINKLDSVTKEPLAGATFKVTHADGRVVGTRNGQYTTTKSGTIRISGLEPGAYVVQELTAPDGYVLNSTPQTVELKANKTYTLDFYNTPLGGLTIIKSDEDTGARIKGARFEIRKQNGEIVGYYTTDANGVIRLPDIDSGWYTVTETKAAEGYLLDATPHSVQVKDGKTATLAVYNRAKSGILIHKKDAVTGAGIYGVTFLLYNGSNNPIGQYTTDQSGRVLIDDDLTAGRYYLRELSTATGYELDTELKTVYVEAGKTIEIRWENQPMRGQIQITKKSGNANELNGFPTGTPLAGAVFEVYDYRTGNLAGRFVSGADGRAVSAPLPLGRYIVKEVQSPHYYILSDKTLDVDIEFAGQIVKREHLNYSANTGVTIRKTGNRETQPGDEIRYTINEVRNTSSVPLTDFYWRDILPADAVRLTRIVTGSYNQSLKYKVMITTNKGDAIILADNLSTTKNNVIDCSNAALGLKNDEHITSFSLLFGTVQAGFSAVEQPQVYVKVLPGLSHQYQFTNRADVGGKYGDAWVVGNSTWVTSIYKKPEPLPKTGY